MQNVYFFGDSNVRFFKESISGWHNFISDNDVERKKEISNKPESYFTGFSSNVFKNQQITFIWQGGFPISRVNKTYLQDKLGMAIGDILLDNSPIFVFQYGRADIQLRLKDFTQIDNLLLKYIKSCTEFANDHNAIAYFSTPIVPRGEASIELIKHFNDTLALYCENFNESRFIDLYSVVGVDFIPEAWDKYRHTNEKDSLKLLNYIISVITKETNANNDGII
jgi:hypothetical protein